MEIKPLYQGMEVFTDKANELDDEIRAALEPIYQRISAEVFSIRDLCHIVISIAMELEAFTVLKRALAGRVSGLSLAQKKEN